MKMKTKVVEGGDQVSMVNLSYATTTAAPTTAVAAGGGGGGCAPPHLRPIPLDLACSQ